MTKWTLYRVGIDLKEGKYMNMKNMKKRRRRNRTEINGAGSECKA
jgi:hypothetical protein